MGEEREVVVVEAKLRAWAGFPECREVRDLHRLAGAFKEAAEAAEGLGCKTALVAEDVGDQQVEVRGPLERVLEASAEYAGRGFGPVLFVADEETFEGLDGRLPENVSVEIED